MKYIKLFEKYTKFRYKIGDYVRYNKYNFDVVDLRYPSTIMIYKIIKKRKKAQGFLDATNVYLIVPVYDMLMGNIKRIKGAEIETNERNIKPLTEEELKDIELFETTEKYNL